MMTAMSKKIRRVVTRETPLVIYYQVSVKNADYEGDINTLHEPYFSLAQFSDSIYVSKDSRWGYYLSWYCHEIDRWFFALSGYLALLGERLPASLGSPEEFNSLTMSQRKDLAIRRHNMYTETSGYTESYEPFESDDATIVYRPGPAYIPPHIAAEISLKQPENIVFPSNTRQVTAISSTGVFPPGTTISIKNLTDAWHPMIIRTGKEYVGSEMSAVIGEAFESPLTYERLGIESVEDSETYSVAPRYHAWKWIFYERDRIILGHPTCLRSHSRMGHEFVREATVTFPPNSTATGNISFETIIPATYDPDIPIEGETRPEVVLDIPTWNAASAGIVTQIKNGQMLVNGQWYAELPNIKVGDPVAAYFGNDIVSYQGKFYQLIEIFGPNDEQKKWPYPYPRISNVSPDQSSEWRECFLLRICEGVCEFYGDA